MILKAFIAVLVTVIALAAVPLTATASEPAENPMTIILIDGSSIRQSEGNIDESDSQTNGKEAT